MPRAGQKIEEFKVSYGKNLLTLVGTEYIIKLSRGKMEGGDSFRA